ncbi:FHA domain-containing protein [Planctomycetota bacterium]
MERCIEMRLIVKQSGNIVNEYKFERGPVYIGRHAHSQVLLPSLEVSRQHAALFATQDGQWFVEDMDSANKTYLNGKAIEKAEIKTGDSLLISSFTIEIDLETADETGQELHLEDTLITAPVEQNNGRAESAREIIIRKPDTEHAPDIRLPARRLKDFLKATEAICKANGPDEILKSIINILFVQFDPFHMWCALRSIPEGPMTSQMGKRSDGHYIDLTDIKANEKITEAIDNSQFMLLPRVTIPPQQDKIRSALIAPILDPSGCFGVLYLENTMDQESYTLSDLDYLMLLAIHTAAILENF